MARKKQDNIWMKEAEKRIKHLRILKKRLEDEESVPSGQEEEVLFAMRREVMTLENALKFTEDDPYGALLPMKYLDGMTDEEMAEKLHCQVSTVWRNRVRLMMMLTIYLYGNGDDFC